MERIVVRMPTCDEYAQLRRAVGWRVPATADVEGALAGTYAAACAESAGGTIGMGRLITDGALYWYIVVVVVAPARQSAGVGTAIMRALEAVVARHSATGVVHVVAGSDVTAFYRRLGYDGAGDLLMSRAVAG